MADTLMTLEEINDYDQHPHKRSLHDYYRLLHNARSAPELKAENEKLREKLRVARARVFLDEIDAANAGNEFLVKESENISGCVIVYPDDDANAKQPRVKTVGLFDSNDVLRAAFILTRDSFNRTQLSTVKALGDAE